MNIIEKLRKLSDQFYNIDSHYGWYFSDSLEDLIDDIEQEQLKLFRVDYERYGQYRLSYVLAVSKEKAVEIIKSESDADIFNIEEMPIKVGIITTEVIENI